MSELLAYCKYSDTVPRGFENESSIFGPLSLYPLPVYDYGL